MYLPSRCLEILLVFLPTSQSLLQHSDFVGSVVSGLPDDVTMAVRQNF
jgi:hypothetical protein